MLTPQQITTVSFDTILQSTYHRYTMSLDMKLPSKSFVELIRENATTCAITNGASRSGESLFSNPCNEKYQGKEPRPKKLKTPTITSYIPRSRMEKMRAGAIKARESKMSKETEATHSTLQLPVVRHADLKDVANMSAKEKNALAASWSERLLNGKGMLPLRFYSGKTSFEQRVNRSIDHFETGKHTTLDGTLRSRGSGGYTFGKVDMFHYYGPSLVICTCGIVLRLGQLVECQSVKMAQHAYQCDGHPDLDILGHTCGNCAKPWLDLGTQYVSDYTDALDGETARLRKNHHRHCVKREDNVTTTIRWLQLYRIFFPDLYKQKLLNEGEIEVKVAPFSTKEIHEGLTRYQADTILPRRSTSELNQFMEDLKDKATMKSLHGKISAWVGRNHHGNLIVLSGNDRIQLEELGYTTERGFLYSKELHKKQLEVCSICNM